MTERDIIEGCIHKEQYCQEQLFKRFASRMMSVCLRYARDEHHAQDILQEGFIKVFNSIKQYKFEGNFEGWMRKVFVTTAIRLLANQKKYFVETNVIDNNSYSINADAFSKLSADEIHALICTMPEGYKTVFNLSVVEGYSHDEIAEILGVTASTSRGQLLKARKYLQEKIEQMEKIKIK